MADGDPHAVVQIVSLPPDSLVATEAAMLLLHRDDDASLHYTAPSLPELEGLTPNAGAVARALSRYRERAGLPPLVHAEDESVAHGELAPGMLYATQRGDRQRMERIGLALMAGWKVEGSIRDGGFVQVPAPGRGSAEWLAALLAMPIGREVLLDPARDAVAVGFAPLEGGTAGVITGYTFFEEGDEVWAARAFSDRLAAARAARGVPPPAPLTGLPALQQEADRVRTEGVHPRDALDQAMARLQRKITRPVEGVVVEAHHPDALVIPEPFLRDGALPYVVAATFHQPEGAAWGQWVFFLVAFR
jgi:hypothetical protein